jgi:hypothetical protein
LRRNLPSLAWSGPPQQRHATSPSVAGPGRASNPTTSYFAAQTGQWNSVAIDFIQTRGFAIQFGLVLWPRSFIVALGGSRSPAPLANRHTQGNSTPARTSLGNDAAWASFRPRFPYPSVWRVTGAAPRPNEPTMELEASYCALFGLATSDWSVKLMPLEQVGGRAHEAQFGFVWNGGGAA